MTVNPYQVLGLTKEASDDEVRKAFRRLAGELHPDKNPGDTKAEVRFKEVNNAYQLIGSPDKRKAYDQSVQQPKINYAHVRQHANNDADFSFRVDSFFQTVAGVPRTRRPPPVPSNVEMKISISLEESISGCIKDIESPSTTQSKCTACDGLRVRPGTPIIPCGSCGGSGRRNSFTGNQNCCVCGGRGTVPVAACINCNGSGSISTKRRVTVKIPAGIDNGQKLRLAGMGNNGAGSSAPGDLYVEIDILSHPLYKRDGLNLTTEYTLNLAEAIRGGTILVPTINGEKITMKVPPNVRPGATIICARGHGIRSTMRTEQGDLYIRLCLKLPESLTSRAAKLIEELVDELEHKS